MQHSCKTMDMSPVLWLMSSFRTKKLLLTRCRSFVLRNEKFYNLEMSDWHIIEELEQAIVILTAGHW